MNPDHILAEGTFPIQQGSGFRMASGGMHYAPPTSIPMWLAEIAYEDYRRRYGNDQPLAQLGKRGGFSRAELLDHLRRELNRRATLPGE